MKSICNANCNECQFKEGCKGCENTCGSPFGGRCIAAEYIKVGGIMKYSEMKETLLTEINSLLTALELPKADNLCELKGEYVNLEYILPCGETVKFLNDNNIYLGTQIEIDGLDRCFGVVADMDFILICSYGDGGSTPELICYRKR